MMLITLRPFKNYVIAILNYNFQIIRSLKSESRALDVLFTLGPNFVDSGVFPLFMGHQTSGHTPSSGNISTLSLILLKSTLNNFLQFGTLDLVLGPCAGTSPSKGLLSPLTVFGILF